MEIAVIHQPNLFEGVLYMSKNTENALPKSARITAYQRQRMRIYEQEVRLYPEARMNDHSIRRLAAAVVLKAVADAKSNDPDLRREALYWMGSEAAKLFYDALGLEKNCFEKWVANGMPATSKEAAKVYAEVYE